MEENFCIAAFRSRLQVMAFEEAMENLLAWDLYDEIPKTEGFIRLVECYNNGKFPGLGVIKRYSLMHHMQMMSEYLGDE